MASIYVVGERGLKDGKMKGVRWEGFAPNKCKDEYNSDHPKDNL
jgi:hypothetical protein